MGFLLVLLCAMNEEVYAMNGDGRSCWTDGEINETLYFERSRKRGKGSIAEASEAVC